RVHHTIDRLAGKVDKVLGGVVSGGVEKGKEAADSLKTSSETLRDLLRSKQQAARADKVRRLARHLKAKPFKKKSLGQPPGGSPHPKGAGGSQPKGVHDPERVKRSL